MPTPSQVSCIVPYAGADKYIAEVVASALAQGFGEIIIVNDGFDPAPLMDVAKMPSIKIIGHAKSLGCPLARNVGLKVAANPYVVLLDHDDILCPGYLSAIMAWVAENRLRCAAATLLYIGESSKRVGSIVSRHPDFFLPSGFFAEASLMAEVGYFPDSLSDDLLFFRAVRRVTKLTTCPTAKVLYRIHPKAESSRNTMAWWAFNQLLPLLDAGTYSLEKANAVARDYAAHGTVPPGLEARFDSYTSAHVRLAARNAYACWLNRDVPGTLRYGGKLLRQLPQMIHLLRYKWGR
jgi:glycosyltransferase involved in cell wall biosynthesis